MMRRTVSSGWVIRLTHPDHPDARHRDGDWGKSHDPADARVFPTKEMALSVLYVCGMYRMTGWSGVVERAK